MTTQVDNFREIIHELTQSPGGALFMRFLTVPAHRTINRVSDVISLDLDYDPVVGVRDVFAGRVLTVGRSPRGRDGEWLELRMQVQGVQDWPGLPVVGLWKCGEHISGVLLMNPHNIEEPFYFLRNLNKSDCTTFNIAFAVARLLEGS